MNDAKNGDVVVDQKANSSSSQKEAPKFSLKQTSAAKKRGKPFPKFTQGEMLPWKGVWFRVTQVAPPEEGKHNGIIVLEPMIERIYD